jgi:plasmid stabilization system protein ParE
VNVRFLDVAEAELREAVAFYDAQRPGLGDEFREEVRATIERIRGLPEGWQPLSENTRRCRTKRFPFGVIYRAEGEDILIVAIAHLHREPGRWRDGR